MKYSIMISDLTSDGAMSIIEHLNNREEEPITIPAAPQTGDGETLPVVPDTVGVAVIAGAIPAAAPVPVNTAAATAGVETDKNGLPWDERIHSGNRKKTAKGIWQKRRGLQDFEYDAVVKELQAGDWRNWKDETPSTPAPVPVDNGELDVEAFVERNNLAPVPGEPVVTLPVFPAPVAAVPVPPAAVAVPVVPVAAVTARDFMGLMAQIQQLFDSQQIQPSYLNSIVSRINENFPVKIVALTDVSNDANLIDYAWKCLDADGKAA